MYFHYFNLYYSPKCYWAQGDDGSSKQATKGIPGSSVCFSKFWRCLYDGAEFSADYHSIHRKRAKLSRVITNKKQLNPIHLKFKISEDNITCSPLEKNNQLL